MDDSLAIISSLIWVLALGMWPVAFFFQACPCCDAQCPWLINFDRCLRVAVVGSEKPEGWDCRLSPTNFNNPNRVVANSLEINNLPARIRIPIRVDLSTVGAARTPIGQTRFQTWRLNRATVANVSPYDVVGPPWFLEMEIEVEGVAADDDADVTSFQETDAYGQLKIRLEIKQGPTAITHTQQVELELVGLQRWFSLTEFAANATLEAGQSYAGWTVAKATGITVLERKLAVNFPNAQSFCTGGAQGTLAISPQKTILDDDTAAAFLIGEEDLQLRLVQTNPTATLEVNLRVLPANAMCEIWDFGTGVAAGVYPEKIYVEPSEQYTSQTPAFFPKWCAEKDLPVFAFGDGSCVAGWGPVFYVRGRSWAVSRDDDIVTPQQFWPGRTLLWNIEHGPYRTEAVLGVIGGSDQWTYKLESEAEDEFWTRSVAGCPAGMTLFEGRESVFPPARLLGICMEAFGPFRESKFPQFNTSGFASFIANGSLDIEIDGDSYSVGGAVPMIFVGTYEEGGQTLARFSGISDFIAIPSDPPKGATIGVLAIGSSIECEQSGQLNLSVVDARYFGPAGPFSPLPAAGGAVTATVPETLSYSHLLRFSCGDWDAAEIPPEGATLTRKCKLSDDSEPAADLAVNFELDFRISVGSRLGFQANSPPRSLAFSPSSSYLPRHLFQSFQGAADGSQRGSRLPDGSAPILQRPNCRILRLNDFADPPLTASRTTPFTIISANVVQGQCIILAPIFGSPITPNAAAGGSPCQSQLRETTLPCHGCTPGVSLVSGENNGTVQWISEGDKAGIIEIVALRTWLGGQGIVFTLTCGEQTETVTVRRQNTTPSAPSGLTAARPLANSATLSWTAPHDGGSPITNYAVQFRPVGVSFWTAVSRPSSVETSATVSGLAQNLGYEFRVAAINSLGTGPFSQAASVQPFAPVQ